MKATGLWTRYRAHLLNIGVTERRIHKLQTMFIAVDRGLEGRIEKASKEDIQAFVTGLHQETFTRKDGKPYSGSTQSDIKKFLKQFYKWLEDSDIYPDRVRWIKTGIAKDKKPKQKRTVSLQEVSKLASKFKRLEYRYVTLVLFDSGFRIEELLSAKKKDLEWKPYDDNESCWWIKCNTSKTFTRSVPIPLFTDEITAYTKSPAYLSQTDEEPLFPISYRVYYNTLRQTAQEVIGEPIAPHHLRHSSATHYAVLLEGNVPLLASRYGWSFNAPELQTYVRESGSYQKTSVKKVFENEMSQMKAELERLKTREAEQEQKLRLLESLIKELNVHRKLGI